MYENNIVDVLNALPNNAQQEVMDFIEFLSKKYKTNTKPDKLKFNWAGGLSELRDKYTSVELQHKISELR